MGNPIKEKTSFSCRDISKPAHQKAKLSLEERAAWILRELEKFLEGPDVTARLAQQEVQRVKAVQEHAAAAENMTTVSPQEYRLDFRSLNDCTIQEVLNNSRGSGYFLSPSRHFEARSHCAIGLC